MEMSEQNKETFVQNKAFKDLIQGAKSEFDQVMQDPAEQIAFWKNERDQADARLDEIINNHWCTLSKHEACAVSEALVDAGLTTYPDQYREQEERLHDRADMARKDLPF